MKKYPTCNTDVTDRNPSASHPNDGRSMMITAITIGTYTTVEHIAEAKLSAKSFRAPFAKKFHVACMHAADSNSTRASTGIPPYTGCAG
jgi:hypothetical protein